MEPHRKTTRRRKQARAIETSEGLRYFAVIPWSGEFWEFHAFGTAQERNNWAQGNGAHACQAVPDDVRFSRNYISHSGSDDHGYTEDFLHELQVFQYYQRNDPNFSEQFRSFYECDI